MRKCVQRGLFGVLCAGGIIVLGTGAASAAQTSGDEGLLSGNQILPQVEVPVSADGNTASVIGDNKVRNVVDRHLSGGSESAKDKSNSSSAKEAAASTSGRHSAAGGNQTEAKASVPVSASGNTVSVVGDNDAKNTVKRNSSGAVAWAQKASESASPKGSSLSTSGEHSVAGGNQAEAKASAPVSASGNTISVVGDNDAKNTVSDAKPETGAMDKKSMATTLGTDGAASGNQVDAKASIPVNASGNAVSVVGDNNAENTVTHAKPDVMAAGKKAAPTTSGTDSIAGGNQADATVKAPISANGNTVSVVGDNDAKNSVTNAKPEVEAKAKKPTATTSGRDSGVGGNQVLADVLAPVAADGNTVSVIGDNDTANTETRETGWHGSVDNGSDAATSGDGGVAGGNQVLAEVRAPVSVDGNTVSVLGDNDTRNTVSSHAPMASGATSEPMRSDAVSSGRDGLLAGNQVVPWFFVPVSAEGNALSVIGDNTARNTTSQPFADGPAPATTPTSITSGTEGAAGGNQLLPTTSVPLDIRENTISVIGDNSVARTSREGTAGSGTTPVPATGTPTTSGDDGVAGGNQIGLAALAPVDISGNSITLIGDNTVAAPAASRPVRGPTPDAGITDPVTNGGEGLLGGNQILPDVFAPLDLSGNSIALIGDNMVSAPAGGREPVPGTAPEGGDSNPVTSGADGIAGGNQVVPEVTAPLDLSGNTVAVVGDNTVTAPAADGPVSGTAPEAGTTNPATSGDDGIAGGNQVVPEVNLPITVGGNSGSVIGDNTVAAPATNGQVSGTAPGAGTPNLATSGDDGIAGGNQVVPEVNLPITVGGNTGSVIGDNTVAAPAEGGTDESGTTPDGQGTTPATSGDDGLLGGNQVVPEVSLPITVGGNTGSVIGDNTVTTPGGDGTTDPGTKAENPGIDPEDPGTSPEYPGTGPDEPGMPGTPGEPHMPGDPADPNQPTDPATPGTSTEPAEEMSPVVPAAGQVRVQTGFAATDPRGVVSADIAGVAEDRSMAGTWAGPNENGAANMSASGTVQGADALAQTGANSGSMVWFGGALVLLGLAALGLRRRLGAK